jgi:predicted DCC family thiol-disulfide oxidoreductase YuxK
VSVDPRSFALVRIVLALLLAADALSAPAEPRARLVALVRLAAALGLAAGWRTRLWLGVAFVASCAAVLGFGGAPARSAFALASEIGLALFLAIALALPLGSRYGIDGIAAALRRGVRLDRRPAAPAVTSDAGRTAAIALAAIAAAGAVTWLALAAGAGGERLPRSAWPLAAAPLLLGARAWSAVTRLLRGPARAAVVYYDDACGFCRRCCELLALADGAGRLRFVGASDGGARLHPISDAELGTTAVVVDAATGVSYRRGRAAAAVARALPLPYQGLRLLALPGIGWIADRVYDLVARNRHRLSRAIGVEACAVEPGVGDAASASKAHRA